MVCADNSSIPQLWDLCISFSCAVDLWHQARQQEPLWPDDLHLTGMLRDVWDQSAFQFISPATDPHLPQGHVTAEKSALPVSSVSPVTGQLLASGGVHTASNSFSNSFSDRMQYLPFIDKNLD